MRSRGEYLRANRDQLLGEAAASALANIELAKRERAENAQR
jgi:hypothetical protein